jgi:hypothetical protein
MSIRLTWTLSTAFNQSGQAAITNTRWWKFRRVRVDPDVYTDLHALLASLHAPLPGQHSVWSRPIGLLIPREGNASILSDATYQGIGSWSPTYDFLWRLLYANLLALRFDIKLIVKTYKVWNASLMMAYI